MPHAFSLNINEQHLSSLDYTSLALKVCLFNQNHHIFKNAVLLLTWPWWQKPTYSRTFSSLFFREGWESASNRSSSLGNSSHTTEAEFSFWYLSFANVRGVKHIKCIQLRSFVPSINVYWVSTVCLARCYGDARTTRTTDNHRRGFYWMLTACLALI